MPSASTALTRARDVFLSHEGMLRTRDAIRLGIHPRTLYALRDQGALERVSPGLYRLAKAPALTNPDLVVVATCVPKAVICLISAMSHYRLTTQIPHEIDIALTSHAQVPKVGVPVRVFWYSEPSFSAGIRTELVDEIKVRIYSQEKTIADAFKYRNKIGIDLAIEALRNYRQRSRKPNYRAILEFASINRVERVIRPYLEAMV